MRLWFVDNWNSCVQYVVKLCCTCCIFDKRLKNWELEIPILMLNFPWIGVRYEHVGGNAEYQIEKLPLSENTYLFLVRILPWRIKSRYFYYLGCMYVDGINSNGNSMYDVAVYVRYGIDLKISNCYQISAFSYIH